jgi:hypothetical protein
MNACVDIDQLIVDQTQSQAERQRLAEMLGCLTEEQVALLADVDVSTVRNWRVRKTGPESRAFGRSRLYPLSLLKDFLAGIGVVSEQAAAEPSQAAPRSRVKSVKPGRRNFVNAI